jgi:hypothetical protein
VEWLDRAPPNAGGRCRPRCRKGLAQGMAISHSGEIAIPGALSVHLTDFEWRKEIGESKVTTASIAIEVFADAPTRPG